MLNKVGVLLFSSNNRALAPETLAISWAKPAWDGLKSVPDHAVTEAAA